MISRILQGSGCFLIGATGKGWTKDGKALIGSVSDDPYDIRTFVRAYIPQEGFGHIGTELVSTTESSLTDRGYFAKPNETTRGLNEPGLAFTCAMVIEDGDKVGQRFKNPLEFADTTKKMLLECESVPDAIALFKEAKAITPAYTVLLCDKSGDLAHLEVGSYGVKVLHQFNKDNPGVIFGVNCYRHPDFEDFNDPLSKLENQQNNNQFRLKRGQTLAELYKGSIDVDVLSLFLSDHQNMEIDPMGNPVLEAWGYSICNHGTRRTDDYPSEDLPWGTVSAEIIAPGTDQFWYAYGWPCGSSPVYGDQLFQDNSWGKFIPFRYPGGESTEGYHAFTSITGEILR